jgi:TolB-like protein/Tfp pilus assembly protein PilF
MSPEQARGLAVDGRTDLFSLGAMMYEMIAGRTPFDGLTAADVISDLLNREPASLLHFAPDLPSDFLRIVNKLIRKDRDERYQTAKDLLVDLKVLKREIENSSLLSDSLGLLRNKYDTPESYETSMMASDGSADAITKTLSQSPSTAPTTSSAESVTAQFLQHRRAFLAGLGATTVLATGGIYLWRKRASVIDSIAILPFEFVTTAATSKAETSPLVDTITDSIINNLSQHKSLIVKPRSAVEALNGKPEIEIARMLNARALLTGRIIQQGEALKVSVALIDARDNRHLWGEQYTRQIADLVLLEQEISQQVTNQLLPSLSEVERKKFEAYSLTLKGRNAWSKRTESSLQEAIRLFEQAVQADARYAPAYAGLADSYNMLVNYSALSGAAAFPKSKEAAQKALDLDDKLAEAHAARAYVNFQWDWNWAASEEAFRRAIELKPNYAPAHQWFSSLLACIGRLDEALVTAKRAQELEPYSLIVSSHFAWISYIARHYDETLAQANAKLKLDAKFFAAHRYLALAYQAQGKHTEAIEEFQNALAPSRGSILLRGELAHAYARAGQRQMALQQIEELQKLAGQRYVSAFHYGLIYAGLNDRERALAALNQAVEERAERLVWLGVDPRFDSLRNDARFIDILQRIGLVV